MPAPSALHDLIDRFHDNLDDYRSGRYKETPLRDDFLDPLFELLGWDMRNAAGLNEMNREVVKEDRLKIEGSNTAPDYSFRLGGKRKFFVEAKKPSVKIKEDVVPAFQIRRYAWSAGLPVSLLTDFEEFAVYDCRALPHRHDLPTMGRMEYFKYTELPEKWDYVNGLFSREAVLGGSLDAYAETMKTKRGTLTVDDAFLAEIEDWRDRLTTAIALRNADITQEELNFAVQRTIDRIIFLRICEARGIEEYGRLKDQVAGGNAYAGLLKLFHQADARYNSGLFHFKKEKGEAEGPDAFTPTLAIDDEQLRYIIGRLYYPESPYEFSVLPASILGNIYERFLGKAITLDELHAVRIDEKPEVKKAGGVYYTPDYISEYIVANTVGKKLEGLTPKEAAALTILDPACGSGSFLLAAYDYLLDWHLAWYVANDPAKWAKGKNAPIYRAAADEPAYDSEGEAIERSGWKLTTAAKKKILLDNIYGVDIDRQAVEVTKLSLLLRVLEGESSETLGAQMKLFQDRVLPDLGRNIKCGNSLIGSDFYDDAGNAGLSLEERRRVNAFDWEREFGEVMKERGGFDVVIGNPPYVLMQAVDDVRAFEYLSKRYSSATYKIDTYQVFVELGMRLLAIEGRLGFITPSSFMKNKHAFELRRVILGDSNVEKLVLFYYSVFKGASVDVSIIVLHKQSQLSVDAVVEVVRAVSLADWQVSHVQLRGWREHKTLDFTLADGSVSESILALMSNSSVTLGDYATAYFGIQTYDRKVHVSKEKHGEDWKPIIDGSNIRRYELDDPIEYVDFRAEAIKSGGKKEVYERRRVAVRQIGEVPVATVVEPGVFTLNTVYNIYLTCEGPYPVEFVMGLISSKLIQWYWRRMFFDQKKTFPKIKKDYLLAIPLPIVGEANEGSLALRNTVVQLVIEMLALKRKMSSKAASSLFAELNREADRIDRQIDRAVYGLFALSEAEIAHVESGA